MSSESLDFIQFTCVKNWPTSAVHEISFRTPKFQMGHVTVTLTVNERV